MPVAKSNGAKVQTPAEECFLSKSQNREDWQGESIIRFIRNRLPTSTIASRFHRTTLPRRSRFVQPAKTPWFGLRREWLIIYPCYAIKNIHNLLVRNCSGSVLP